MTLDDAALSSEYRRVFVTTIWGIIEEAQRGDPAARAKLYRTYVYPLYTFFRRQGATPEDAEDLVQDLWCKLLANNCLEELAPENGRVRTWLLRCASHLWLDQTRRARASKRGGDLPTLSWDALEAEQRYRLEPLDPASPEQQFDRAWAQALIDRGLDLLRGELQAGGKQDWFDQVKGFLGGERERGDYERVAGELNMSPEALKQAVFRLRKRLRELLRAEVSQTVEKASQVEEEIRDLICILGN